MPGFLGTERQFNELYSRPINLSRDSKSNTRDQENGALALEALHRQVPIRTRYLDHVIGYQPIRVLCLLGTTKIGIIAGGGNYRGNYRG